MIWFTIILMICWPFSWGFIAYDCEGPVLNMTTISLKEVEDCNHLESDYDQQQIYAKVIQRNEIKLVQIRSCLVEITRIIYHCGMHSHISAVANGLSSFVYQIGAEECRNIHNYKAFRIYQQTIGGITMNGTTSASIVSYGTLKADGSCQGTSYSENGYTWTSVVITSTIKINTRDYMAPVKLETNEISLLDGVTCSYLEGYCLDSTYGETIWNYIPETNCDAALSLLYEGTTSLVTTKNSQKYIIVDQNEKIFALTLIKPFILCSYELWQTEHPKIIILMSSTKHIQPQMPLLVQNTNLMSYVNSKFLYVEQSFKRSIEQLYIDTIYRRCLLHREMLRNRLLLAHIFPDAISALLKQKPGLTGRILGEAIYIMQCTPKVAKIRRTQRCYNQLPIELDEKELFVTPLTHIIQHQAEEVDCNTLTPPLYHIDNQWVGFTPHPVIKQAPEVLKVDEAPRLKFMSIQPLGSEGIYTSEEINKVQRNLLFGIERKNIENIISRKISGYDTDNQGFSTINLFNKEELKIMAKSTFKQLWGWFTDIGIFISGIIGFYYIILLIKYIGGVGLRAATLYKTIGCGWYLLTSVWGTLATWILHQNFSKQAAQSKKDLSETKPTQQQPIPTTQITIQPTCPTQQDGMYPDLRNSSHWTDSNKS